MLKSSQKLSQIELSFVNLSLRLDGKGFLKTFADITSKAC